VTIPIIKGGPIMRISRNFSLDQTDVVGFSAASALLAVVTAYYSSEINRAFNQLDRWLGYYHLSSAFVMPWIVTSLMSAMFAAYFIGRHWRDANVISRVIVSAALLISAGLIMYGGRVPLFSHLYHSYDEVISSLDESKPEVAENERRWFDPKLSPFGKIGYSKPFCDNILNADSLMSRYYLEVDLRALRKHWKRKYEKKTVEWAI
jgi:hypothetical protein